jgi:hypothetical protein
MCFLMERQRYPSCPIDAAIPTGFAICLATAQLPNLALNVGSLRCRNLPESEADRVESRCGAVSLGRTYLFPPLSSGGALVVRPWLRFHIPLIEPDVQISRIRLSDKTSRLCLACDAFCSS